jgi:hypothetical protein
MVQWIAEIYPEHLEMTPCWRLPQGAELASAMAVLDYFGLAPNHPKEIDCSLSTPGSHVRAKLFLQYTESVDKAKQFCIDDFLKSSRPVKHFFFAPQCHDMEYTRANYAIKSIPIVTMGEDSEERNFYYEFVHDPRIRDMIFQCPRG